MNVKPGGTYSDVWALKAETYMEIRPMGVVKLHADTTLDGHI